MDEVFLDCPDYYFENSRKMKAIIRYAQEHEYDYLLRLDDDTYFWPERLEAISSADRGKRLRRRVNRP